MADKEFIEFIRVSADDHVMLTTLKSNYNILVSRYNMALIKGINSGQRQLLDQMKDLKEQIDQNE
jgi:hypothetical protein